MESIANWNKEAIYHLSHNPSMQIINNNKCVIIEVDCWNIDGSQDGYIAWLENDKSAIALGTTPYEAYSKITQCLNCICEE